MASLTLTPDPNSAPPSVLVEVAATAGRVVSSVVLTRDGVPVLGSALAGFGTATYTDYSAPYGALCSYRALGVESEQTWPALWSESWSSLAAWTGSSWSVAAGVASSHVYGATLTRSAANFGKTTVADPHYVRLELLSAGGVVVGSVACTSSMVIAGTTSATIAVVDDFEAWIVSSTLYVATVSGSVSVTLSAAVVSVRLVSLATGTQAAAAAALATYSTLTTTTTDLGLTADTTLDATTAWLIHPKTPALSVPLAIDGNTEPALNIERGGIQSATRESQAGRQRAAGASEDAVFTVGNRSAPSLTLSGFTITDACKASLVSLFMDESPVMPRFPASWEMPIDERWYSVGDYTTTFVAPSSRIRKWALPLTPAATPYVVVQPVWSEAALVLAYATESDVIAAFAAEYDKLVNNPRV